MMTIENPLTTGLDNPPTNGQIIELVRTGLKSIHPATVERLARIAFERNLHELSDALLGDEDYQDNRRIIRLLTLVEKGEYFPGVDPYTEEESLGELQQGVTRGIITQGYLDEVLSQMRQSETYASLRSLHKRTYDFDHTPFATNTDGKRKNDLVDYGFHVFIGREIFEDHEGFVTLDFCGSTSYSTFGQAFHDLCSAVKKDRKVLLSKSPGEYKKDPNNPLSLASRRYEPFNLVQMGHFKVRFQSDPELLMLENPFSYQPK